ncbi:hypothetical protein [Magnetovibrio sp.]|uniref:hypothetical protein n=1 Tax=Magnetovibrio sp. TaxID=2024836 RepID=UPI002F953D96
MGRKQDLLKEAIEIEAHPDQETLFKCPTCAGLGGGTIDRKRVHCGTCGTVGGITPAKMVKYMRREAAEV